MGDFHKAAQVIKKGYLTHFILLIISIFVIGTTISAVYLYLDIYRPLSTHYSAILSIVTELKEMLIIRTIKINAVFCLLIIVGIVISGILYTHRIDGPLHRVKLYTKMVSEGRLDTKINFRRKDAIHSFAESLNKMTESYNNRVTLLTSEIQELKNALAELKSMTEEDKDTEVALKKVIEQDSRIQKLLRSIKV